MSSLGRGQIAPSRKCWSASAPTNVLVGLFVLLAERRIVSEPWRV